MGNVIVELAAERRPVGKCEGIVMKYFAEDGIGLMGSSQVDGEIHFEAPAKAREEGLNMQGLRIAGNVEYSCDGRLYAKEVRLKSEEEKEEKEKAEDNADAAASSHDPSKPSGKEGQEG